MGLACGIVGLPNVGTTTIYDAITLTESASRTPYMFSTTEPARAAVNVPDPRLARILSEISYEEEEVGRGMLSVLVVRKDTHRPGVGFFTLAEEEFGRAQSNPEAFWQREKAQVFTAWGGTD